MGEQPSPMITSSSNEQVQLNTLRAACEQGTFVELEVEMGRDQLRLAGARLINMDNDVLYIDRPYEGGVPLDVTCGTCLQATFMMAHERYTFRTHVDQEYPVRLAGHNGAQGVALVLPEHVVRHERRTDCRVSLAGCSEVIGQFRRLPPDGDAPLSGQIMNISAGGMAAVAIDVDPGMLRVGDCYLVEFQLPKIKRTFCFRTMLRHIKPLGSAGVVMGLKYLPESNATEMRHAIRQISQFVAKQLKDGRKPSVVRNLDGAQS